MTRLILSAPILVLGSFVGLLCAAQAPQSAETVLHTTTNLVLVDVVVADKGQAIHGLDQTRFHVFEDGHEQSIASFDEYRPAAAPAEFAPPPPLPPDTYSNVPSSPANGALNVLLLDALNTPKADQANMHRQIVQYVGNIQPGTSLAIFALGSRLDLVQGFTTDSALLAKALKSPKALPQASATLQMGKNAGELRDEAEDAARMPATIPSAFGANEAEASRLRMDADEVTAHSADLRVPATLGAMQQLARYLSGFPGRKNLVWFSGSFPIDLMPNLLDPEAPSEFMRTYANQVRETGRLLAAARIAVYPIYAGTPLATASLQASHDIVAADSNPVLGASGSARNDTLADAQIRSEQAAMVGIAQMTGGRYFNTTDLKEALAGAIDNGSSYYTISYVPSGKLDGKFRDLKVRLDGARYDLSYRRGYYADAPDKPSPRNPGEASPIMAAAAPGAPEATQIQFKARVLLATDPMLKGSKLPDGPAGAMSAGLKGPLNRYIVDLTVDARGLSFAEMPDGGRQASIEFVLVGYDGQANRVNYMDSTGKLNLNSAQLERLMKEGFSERLALDLPPRQIALRIVVYDRTAARAGSLEVPLEKDGNPKRGVE